MVHMKSCIRIVLLFALSLAVCMPAQSAKRKKGLASVHEHMLMEPDAMPVKSRQTGRLVAASKVDDHKLHGKINSRWREGIDVSHYQGTIDWAQVARGNNISYAYMKATEGATYVDDTYTYNIREARRAGLSVGSYHFYRPNVSPEEQFENMVSNIKANEQDLAPIIDIEHRGNVSEGRFIADLKALIRMVEHHYGCKPLLYSYQNFYNRYLIGHFDGYHFMIAKYQDEQPILNDGRTYIMWQYTSKGAISGISGHVDRSRIMDSFNLSQVGI